MHHRPQTRIPQRKKYIVSRDEKEKAVEMTRMIPQTTRPITDEYRPALKDEPLTRRFRSTT